MMEFVSIPAAREAERLAKAQRIAAGRASSEQHLREKGTVALAYNDIAVLRQRRCTRR